MERVRRHLDAPRFNDDGSLKSPAYITALHNGVLILNHFALKGDTPYSAPPKYAKHADRLPIRLQDHGNPTRFRNIWIRNQTGGGETGTQAVHEEGQRNGSAAGVIRRPSVGR